MLGDDAGAAPPIKGVCRSASIALRKANLAKETGDADEELAQLRSFNRTIANVLRLHPMYARKKQDEEVAGLDAKLPEVHRRMEALGGKVAPPPETIAEAAASVAERLGDRGHPALCHRLCRAREPRQQEECGIVWRTRRDDHRSGHGGRRSGHGGRRRREREAV